MEASLLGEWRAPWRESAEAVDRQRPRALTIAVGSVVPSSFSTPDFRFSFESEFTRIEAGGVSSWVGASDPPAAAARARAVLEAHATVGPPGAPAPAALGGWAFDPERPMSGPWSPLDGVSVVVPRIAWRPGFATLFLRAGETVDDALDLALAPGDPSRTARARPEPGRDPGSSAADPARRDERPSEIAVDRGSRAQFERAVRAAVERIHAGHVAKVVLSRRTCLSGRFSASSVHAGLRRPDARSARFSLGFGDRTFLGATPELLVRRQRGAVETEALAGSAPPEEGDALRCSPKDLEEHRRVVEHVTDVARSLGADPRGPPEPELRRLGYVTHLSTPIALEGRTDLDAWQWGAALHPTPAIGGWPTAPALEVIRDIEPEPRGWYCGALGWVDARGDGELYVALRSALVEPDGATVFVGVGLVDGSDPTREWEETRWKERAMLEALGATEADAISVDSG